MDDMARTAMPRRPFRLLDAMILVAATAIGCAGTQWITRDSNGAYSWALLYDEGIALLTLLTDPSWRDASWRDIGQQISLPGLDFLVLATPLAMTWTLALIPIALIGPRPRFRRLARRPGMMAACAAALAFAFIGLHAAIITLGLRFTPMDPVGFLDSETVLLVYDLVGLAVLASWMTLIVGRRWRPERTWIDRLGRAAGVFWIVMGFAATALFLVVVASMTYSGSRSIRSINVPLNTGGQAATPIPPS